MSFEKNFCPSPWFHTSINNTGAYEFCRWATKQDRTQGKNIRDQDPITWFQQGMAPVRKSMLDGVSVPGCRECDLVDTHGKVSGRQRQRLKIGINPSNFEKSLLSSPWIDELRHSLERDGHSDLIPRDWQINLGNFCNSACLFCTPYSSSRLASEFKKIGLIDKMPDANWCEDPNLLNEFVNMLSQSPKLCYLHFIGGETLITPAFQTILQALVNNGLSEKISIGFTTNLTTWNQSVINLLSQFKEVNLGMSIECIHPLNDYIRYGGTIDTTMKLLNRWVDLARQLGWLVQLRITPTVFSIWHLDTVYEYAFQNQLAVESCNFLEEPAYMRPSVLPRDFRDVVIKKLQNWVACHTLDNFNGRVINTRDPNVFHQQIIEDIKSYVNYLQTQPDESDRLSDLVKYIKTMEKNRGNSIISYLPEYEKLLRPAGY
jgi:hypothetical protein